MSNDINFKELWNNRQAALPDAAEIYKKGNAYKRKALIKLIVLNILLVATCIFIGFIWFHYQPQFLTTKLGIALIISALLLYLLVYNQSIPLLLKNKYDSDNQNFMEQMLRLKNRQSFLQTVITNVYFALLSAGLGLYMIEYIQKMPVWGKFLSYGITTAWIAFNWFYIKPKTIKKEQKKLNEVISKLEEINRQG